MLGDAGFRFASVVVGVPFAAFRAARAAGCTIGQGLSAGAMLSLTWPFAVGGIALGGWLGLMALEGRLTLRSTR